MLSQKYNVKGKVKRKNNMKVVKPLRNDVIAKIQKISEDNPYTNYIKYTCNPSGELTSVCVFADTSAERQAFESCIGFSTEEVAVVSALSETQRKIILLQSQKEKIEKQLSDLIK